MNLFPDKLLDTEPLWCLVSFEVKVLPKILIGEDNMNFEREIPPILIPCGRASGNSGQISFLLEEWPSWWWRF